MDRRLSTRLTCAIKDRSVKHLLRTLPFDAPHHTSARHHHDFASNDYLGISNSKLLLLVESGTGLAGSTGSRLLSGDSQAASNLEHDLALVHHAESGLLFNCGYTANLSVISALVRPGDTIVLDQHVHASVWDGVRMVLGKYGSLVTQCTFKHNDIDDLFHVLCRYKARTRGVMFVAVESIYSMDGSVCLLKEMVDLASQRVGAVDVYFIVDEAHACGILGQQGSGLVCQLGLADCKHIVARVHTFGKAIGCHGAIVFGSKLVRKYLINYARPLIYSTMMPPHALTAIQKSYRYIGQNHTELVAQLQARISTFKNCARQYALETVPSETHIQAILVPGNARVMSVSRVLIQNGIYVLPIRSPTVAMGTERLRVCLHVFNSQRAIDLLCQLTARTISDVPVSVPLQSNLSLNPTLSSS